MNLESLKKLNEALEKHIVNESSDYKLTIITDRDRDDGGKKRTRSIKADNDLEALLKVFKKYDVNNKYIVTENPIDLDDEDKEKRQKIDNCIKNQHIKTGVEMLTDLYFDGFDPSDYLDDIIKLEGPNGVVIEDIYWDQEDETQEDEYDETKDLGHLARVEKAERKEKLFFDMFNELKYEIKGIAIKNKTTFIEGLTAYLYFPDICFHPVSKIESYPEKSDDKGFSVYIQECPAIGLNDEKVLENVSIDEIKQFILDNEDILRAEAEYARDTIS